MGGKFLQRLIGGLFGLALISSTACAGTNDRLSEVRLPPGFSIEIFASAPGVRAITVSTELKTVFAGSTDHAVYGIPFAGEKAGKTLLLKAGLTVPHGVAWRDGYLYVGEQHRISRYRGDSLQALSKARPETIFDDLTDSGWHGRRDLAFGPDGKLYVSAGSPCNICMPEGNQGVIIRMNPDGSDPAIFARGIRNSVGMDFHPLSGALHFTDNGADQMGDDLPPEELNRAEKAGLHFGYPFFGGGDARTDEFSNQAPPASAVQPDLTFSAHVAPLGLHFYKGGMFPADMRGDAFVAHHGSWNRSIPDGYRVARVRFDEKGRAQSWEPFTEGLLAWGRPVDINELPDGSLLISDDRQGVIYRISYTP
ncbi:MAG: sorbosone dehydrogenase family protein [Rhodospirillaceae bacterium]|nr:sorbosone dehydrogenase family protein [Rhodospirillaceae bacterium]MBT5243961.1 sorbosone dehydrogenase family protein [Rhodospirillaceae bacterium]MBT5560942.1 sorbosone dehydrogenase family protein [Rhodospirillaceae bacterium]MBT6242473.1 sorbosone dehydrogenase family protein [Rhodospirillaceae bacterium]